MNRAAGGMGSLMSAYADLENGDFTPPPSSSTKPPAKKPASKTTTTTRTAPRSSSSTKKTATTAAKASPTSVARTTTTTAKSSSSTSKASAPVPTKLPSSAKTPSSKATAATTTTTPAKKETATNDDDDEQEQDGMMLRQMSKSPSSDQQTTMTTSDSTITQSEQQAFVKQVEALKETLKKENKKFTQPWDKKEEEEYDWVRLSSPEYGYQLFPGGSADNISASEIKQVMGDCWLASVIAVLTHSRKNLVRSLFIETEVNEQCVYAVKLWSAGQWHLVLLDDRFPVKKGSLSTDKTGANLKFACAASATTKSMWVSLLEKAVASFHGNSYENLRGGVSMEAFLDFTGLPVKKVRFPQVGDFNNHQQKTNTTNNNSTNVNSPQELAKKMGVYFKNSCVMAASCGGGSGRDAYAQKMNLRPQHSYSVLDIKVVSPADPNQIFVLCRDPWSSTDAASPILATNIKAIPEKTRKELTSAANHDKGEFWISIDQFMRCYNLLVVCITKDYSYVVSGKKSALCLDAPEKSFLPSNLEDCAVEFTVVGGENNSKPTSSSSSSSSSLVNFYAMASQRQIRNGKEGLYFDLCVMILKLPSAETATTTGTKKVSKFPKLVAMTEIAVDRISTTFCSIKEPGHYIAFPVSFNQHKFSSSELFVTLLVEGDNKKGAIASSSSASSSFRLVSSPSKHQYPLIYSSMNRWFSNFIISHPDVEARLAKNNFWDLFKLQYGLLSVSLVRAVANQHNQYSIISVDTKGSVGTCVPGRGSGSNNSDGSEEEQYQVVVAPKKLALVHLSVPMPWNDEEGTQINSAMAWTFKTKAGDVPEESEEEKKKVPRMYKSF